MAHSEPIDQLGTSRGPEKDGLRIGHLNTHGMKKATKIRDIKNFIRNHKFDILAISETWLEESDSFDDILIPGYQKPIRADRPTGGKKEDGYGGSVVYIRNGIAYDLVVAKSWVTRKNVDMSTQNIHIEVKSDRNGDDIPHINISALYIPPQSEKCKKLLRRLEDHKNLANVVVLGDVNINQLKPTQTQTRAVKKLGFCQLINEITRPSSRTLLDHIYVQNCQVKEFISESGVIQCSISDHDFIFCTISKDFLQRGFSTPTKMYETIIRGSGNAKAAVKLRKLCQVILCKIAADESEICILEPFHEITSTDYDFIISKYDEWRKLFWEEFGDKYLDRDNQKTFIVHANSELEFLWIAIGLHRYDMYNVDDERFVFLDYAKWYEKTKANHMQSLRNHSARDGKGAVAVHYNIHLEDDRHMPLWKIYVVYIMSQLSNGDLILQCSDGMVGCKISKKDTSTSTFTQVLNKIIRALNGMSFVKVTDWEPLGNSYVFSKKVAKQDVQRYIEKEYDVDVL